jgi:galactokinase
MSLKSRLLAAFDAHFGGQPDIVTRAPGRVNLIGEHTDYNEGFVLPAALGCETLIAARRRADSLISLCASDIDQSISQFDLDLAILPDASAPWSNYVRGVAHVLQSGGVPLAGADIMIMGNVPQGAGLSSSASLEISAGLALAALGGRPDIDRTMLALAGQRAEHDFAGCNCGIMDQLVSAHGQAHHALLIDCRSLDVTPVAMPSDMAIMIVHSGISRGLVDGEYNLRRTQCDAAAAHYGAKALRDVSLEAVAEKPSALDDVPFRRARHVVTENSRTLQAAKCLAMGDLEMLGRLMQASHCSMRDDFNITLPAIDQLVDLLAAEIGSRGGARMTGGGFGGAVVALMPEAVVPQVAEAVLHKYRTPAGTPPTILHEKASAGASILAV